MKASDIYIQPVEASWLKQNNLTLDVLRLDAIHKIVSGNKWFKLKHYLKHAKANKQHTIATFGGAWSNHIVATAFAAKEAGFKSVGIIRGEEPVTLSATLQNALHYGMQLIYVTRDAYRDKQRILKTYANNNWYWINEGGYGKPGVKGITDIFKTHDASMYDYLVTAVGTGTTLAGMVKACNKHQKAIGVSSMKMNIALQDAVNNLLPKRLHNHFTIVHDYHFGGYGKHLPVLIDFMNTVYHQHHLQLDFIYTAKTLYAIQDLAKKSFFKQGSKLLMLHTGGLQGNRSLAAKVLAF